MKSVGLLATVLVITFGVAFYVDYEIRSMNIGFYSGKMEGVLLVLNQLLL